MIEKRCEGCDEEDSYCSTYEGPLYKCSKPKVLFIGLDCGKADKSIGPEERRAGILQYYREQQKTWNGHYKGCVHVASYLLRLDCHHDCIQRCARKSEADCGLLYFGQGNAVKCVPPDKSNMDFTNRDRVSECLPLMIEEIATLVPNVIVLQGRNDLDGPFRQLTSKRAVWKPTRNRHVDVVEWSDGAKKSIIVVSLRHPARGWLEADWKCEIIPALNEVQRLL